MLQQRAIYLLCIHYMIAFTRFFTNNSTIFPLSYIGSGGKEDATADGHSYHAYTYMIAF